MGAYFHKKSDITVSNKPNVYALGKLLKFVKSLLEVLFLDIDVSNIYFLSVSDDANTQI